MPRVEQLAREEVVREAQGAPAADRPWEARIPKRQTAIRQAYLDYAAELSRSTDPRDIAFGRKIEAFVQEMPASATRRHGLRRELAAYAKARESEAQRETKLDNTTGRSLDSERER